MVQVNIVFNRIFSKNALKSLIKEDIKSNYYSMIKRYNNSYLTNYDLINAIYEKIKTNNRNEYFYKNTLLDKLLLKTHNPATSVALTEIPIAQSIADFVLINGKAVVYEIKTEFDNLDRLDSQLSNYYKAFDNICVFTAESTLNVLLKKIQNENIGVYYISKKGTLRTYRKPISDISKLDYETIFKILRKNEYEEIISKFYKLPIISQFKYFDACMTLFKMIPIDKAYAEFKRKLKQRNKINFELLSDIPEAMRGVAYFSNLTESEYIILESFLNRKIGG